jgi:hypothetical protein
MEDIKIIYPTYDNLVCLNYVNKTVISKNNDKGKFLIDTNILKITWNNKEEIFILIESIDEACTIKYTNTMKVNENISKFIFIKDNNSVNRDSMTIMNTIDDNINIILINNRIIDYFSLKQLGKYKTEKNIESLVDKIIIRVKWNTSIEETYIKNNSTEEYYIYEEHIMNDNLNELDLVITQDNSEIKEIYLNNELYIINNNKIYDIKNKDTLLDFFIINDNKIKIKFENKEYFSIFEVNDPEQNNYFYDNTEKYNVEVFINHTNWIGICTLNNENEHFYRNDNIQEYGKFMIEDNILTVYWDKWELDKFKKDINYNSIECYSVINTIEESDILVKDEPTKIILKHINWSDTCTLDLLEYKLYREYDKNEFGYYTIDNNKLTIKWDKWSTEVFYEINNIYYFEGYIKFISFTKLNSNNIFNKAFSIKDGLDNFIINLFNNKLYTNESSSDIGNFYFEENYIFIDKNDKEFKKYYYVNDIDKNIIAYIDSHIEIVVTKDSNKSIILNLLDNKFTDSIKKTHGLYNINLNNSTIDLKFSSLSIENYTYKDNKYYYTDYLNNSGEIIFIDKYDGNFIKYNKYEVDIFENNLICDNIKYKYLKTNNNYCIIINNTLVEYIYIKNIESCPLYIVKNIYNIVKDLYFDIEIYSKLYRDLLYNKSELEIYLHWLNFGINNDKIYSIDSFLLKNPYFNIKTYNKRYNLNNDADCIVHWYKNGIFSNYFYSEDYIDIVYDNFQKNNWEFSYEDTLEDKYEYNNEVNPKKYLFSDYSFDIIYTLNDLSSNIYNDLLYIINIDYYNDVNIYDVLVSLPKNINVIININFCEDTDTIYNFYEILERSFNNIILIKSKNIFKYNLLEFINKNIFDIHSIYYENIVYVDLKKNIYNEINILNNLSLLKNNNIILIKNNQTYKSYKKNNLFYYLIHFIKKVKENENIVYTINYLEIIKMLVFYCIIRRKIFELGNKNFIITYNLFKKVIDNNFKREIYLLI